MSYNKSQDIFETSEDVSFIPTFDQMNLNTQILRGIYAYGMEKPSIIQKGLIHSMVAGRDIIAQAQSGTGKTSGFCIGAVNCVDIKFNEPQVLVISPTRELAQQVQGVCLALGSYKNLRTHSCIGGTSIHEDIRRFGEGQHIVSGTPGRIIDMITRGHLNTSALKLFIIDEADQMLSEGFKPQIYETYRSLPPQTQVVIVSATMMADVLHLTSKFMTNPLRILVKRDELTLDEISQYFINVGNEACKFDTLIDIYDTMNVSQAVIFCNSRAKVEWLAEKMTSSNFAVTYMHGDIPQKERDELMKCFRCLETRVLVSTDLWSRGLDVPRISLVVNYDLPQSRETYIHRIGRAGRFGRKGLAINFVTNDEMIILRDIEQFYSTEIIEMPMDASELV